MDKAITREGITRDLEAMKEQGIVGATILNIGLFGGKDFGVPQVAFNTPEWYDMFRFALKEADRLGIEIGIHNCDGWSTTGGPWIKPEQSMKQYTWSITPVEGGQQVSIKLSQPWENLDFYRDVAVIAWPSANDYNSHEPFPDISINDSIDGSVLSDGEPFSYVELSTGDIILFSFNKPKLIQKIAIHPHLYFQWGKVNLSSRFSLEISDDGKIFRKIVDVLVTEMNNTSQISVPPVKAKFVRIIPKEITGLRNSQVIQLSEIELLKEEETPLYSPSITSHLEKTVLLQPGSMDNLVNVGDIETEAKAIPLESVVDLTGKMTPEGQLDWNAPDGQWFVTRFGYTTTGSENGPATAEGRGLECDKMDTSALNHHFRSFPQKLIDVAGDMAGNTFKYLFIDSWECEYQNWCDQFPASFEKRRGYSILPYLPALCGNVVGSTERTEVFLNDFRKTIADLIEENYFKHYAALCHHQGMEIHAEVIYGGSNYPPLDILRSNKYIDLPMTEFWAVNRDPGNTDPTNIKYSPSSRLNANNPTYACAVYHKPLLASEAYTGYAHYSETPWDLKLFGDMAFSYGVNRMVLHSYVHQPWEKKPGFTLGRYGSHFNRHNNWWQHFSAFSTYLARQQYILQQGKSVSEICYFIGDRMPEFQAKQPLYELPYGYKADHCNPDILIHQLVMDNGKIILPDRAVYQMLLLPDDQVMELETLEKLEKLIKGGAIVVGPKPTHCLSLINYDSDNQKLKNLADHIWGIVDGKAIYENSYGKGKVIWGKPIQRILADEKIYPDIENNGDPPENFLFYHKRLDNNEIYYLVNQSDDVKQVEFLFNVMDKRPSIWNPMDGSIHECLIFSQERTRTRIPLTFKPRQTYFVVFEKAEQGEHFVNIKKSGITMFPTPEQKAGPEVLPVVKIRNDGKLEVYAENGGDYTMVSDRGSNYQIKAPETEVCYIESVSGIIDFLENDKSIKTIPINALNSFTDYEDPFIRYFSGTANYRIRFDLPQDWLEPGYKYTFNPGETGATASIQLNGSLLGITWVPGTGMEVNGLLKPDTNSLEVLTTNVWRNRLIGDIRGSDQIQKPWTSSPIHQFLDENSALLPAGFTGPVKLLKYKPVIITLDEHE